MGILSALSGATGSMGRGTQGSGSSELSAQLSGISEQIQGLGSSGMPGAALAGAANVVPAMASAGVSGPGAGALGETSQTMINPTEQAEGMNQNPNFTNMASIAGQGIYGSALTRQASVGMSPLNDSASSGKKHSTMGKQQLENHIEGNNKHRNAKRLAEADKDPAAGKNQIGSQETGMTNN